VATKIEAQAVIARRKERKALLLNRLTEVGKKALTEAF
jgi:hypothetical protein